MAGIETGHRQNLKLLLLLLQFLIIPLIGPCSTRVGQLQPSVSYIRADMALDLRTYKRQIGYSLFLNIALNIDGSGDPTTPIGRCTYCAYNAPHMLMLGWAKTLADVTSDTLPANSTMEVTIPAQGSDYSSVVHVYGDWDMSGLITRLFVSYRVRQGQDWGLPATYNGTVLVHGQEAVLYGSSYVTLLAARLSLGQVYLEPALKLAVQVVGGDAGAATVRLCRYEGSFAAECSTEAPAAAAVGVGVGVTVLEGGMAAKIAAAQRIVAAVGGDAVAVGVGVSEWSYGLVPAGVTSGGVSSHGGVDAVPLGMTPSGGGKAWAQWAVEEEEEQLKGAAAEEAP